MVRKTGFEPAPTSLGDQTPLCKLLPNLAGPTCPCHLLTIRVISPPSQEVGSSPVPVHDTNEGPACKVRLELALPL